MGVGMSLVLFEVKPDIAIQKLGAEVSLTFHSEEEAEKFYIALIEADRRGSSVTINFNK